MVRQFVVVDLVLHAHTRLNQTAGSMIPQASAHACKDTKRQDRHTRQAHLTKSSPDQDLTHICSASGSTKLAHGARCCRCMHTVAAEPTPMAAVTRHQGSHTSDRPPASAAGQAGCTNMFLCCSPTGDKSAPTESTLLLI